MKICKKQNTFHVVIIDCRASSFEKKLLYNYPFLNTLAKCRKWLHCCSSPPGGGRGRGGAIRLPFVCGRSRCANSDRRALLMLGFVPASPRFDISVHFTRRSPAITFHHADGVQYDGNGRPNVLMQMNDYVSSFIKAVTGLLAARMQGLAVNSALFAATPKYHNQGDCMALWVLCKLCVSRLQVRQFRRQTLFILWTSNFHKQMR